MGLCVCNNSLILESWVKGGSNVEKENVDG